MSIQNLKSKTHAIEPVNLFQRLLVVEPDPLLGEMVDDLAHTEGYECKVVSACQDIIKLVRDFKPDLVIIEYLLPGVNGGELCEQLKSDERFSGIPVILWSAYPQILWSVADYRCDEFISKPFDINHLLRAIERLMVKAHERRKFSLLANTLKNKLSYLGKFLGVKARVA